jgi:hypothetical protein
MHAPLQTPTEPEQKTWRGGTQGAHYFDNRFAESLIDRYNTCADLDAVNQLLTHAEPLIRSIIEYRSTVRYEMPEELVSKIQVKLWKSLRLFDRAKGTGFSFIAKIIESVSRSTVAEAWTRSERFCALDEAAAVSRNLDPLSTRQGLAEIIAKAHGVRTSCTLESELRAQRWLVDSFVDAEFMLKRHQASDSMMTVFGLSHARARQLFDLTLVALRRELIDERRLPAVAPLSLRGTKSQALIRYTKILSPEEFSRLATLLKDVAPSVVYTVKPQNFSAIRRGEREATLENLNLLLYGSPTDRPLFTEPIRVGYKVPPP